MSHKLSRGHRPAAMPPPREPKTEGETGNRCDCSEIASIPTAPRKKVDETTEGQKR